MATNHEPRKKEQQTVAAEERIRRQPELAEEQYTGLLALQRTVGNEVVNRMISGDLGSRETPEFAQALPLRLATGQRVQPALKVGAAHDPFEAEADKIAETVMKMSDPDAATHDSSDVHTADGLDDPDVLPMRIRRAASVPDEAAFELSGSAETGVKRVLESAGSPLPSSERNFFESRMGYDLGAVRVHHGPEVSEASRSINAKAFTVGGDIAFGDGAYKPGTPDGRKLLAHELAHVVQQGAAGVQPKRRSSEDER